ncbi:hypothetical protein [Gordonia oryzae]|uniref:hypothetical protein n=1 Tax=Gordonia oryzae TaxID=2487349 RepID=UPI000F50C375|nr:hypothetical protein [Gordonia oryzae]
MSKLSDLLNSGSVTARQAADKAEKAGVDLRYGTIAAYWSGGHGRPTAKTLSKLAKVVPFTEKQLQEAAWDVSAPLGPYVAPDEAALLDERQRRAVDELIRSIVATRGHRHELEATQKSGASGEAREDQKNASRVSTGYGEHTDDYDLAGRDGGTDPEGKAADDARLHAEHFRNLLAQAVGMLTSARDDVLGEIVARGSTQSVDTHAVRRLVDGNESLASASIAVAKRAAVLELVETRDVAGAEGVIADLIADLRELVLRIETGQFDLIAANLPIEQRALAYANRRGPRRTRGEQLRDRDAGLGEESQDFNDGTDTGGFE